MLAASPGSVREVIHAFKDTGLAALDPKWSGGRPAKFGPPAHELICQIARSTPRRALGQPFTTWNLTKLVAYLASHRRLVVPTETTRRVLRQAGITWQATKTWKASRDPDFTAKMTRILVFTPSNASWLTGSNASSRHTTPKRHYAINSKIRSPDYLPNVA